MKHYGANYYETRHVFMALSFVVLFLSPILVFVLPPFVAEGLYYSTKNWHVFVSGTGYLMYSVGFLFLFKSLFVIFLLNMRKISFFMSLICVILAGLSFYIAAQNYTSLGYDGISYREIFTKEQRIYPWGEVERAVYIEVPDQESPPEYEFYFTDGEKLVVVENDTIFLLGSFIRKSLDNEEIWIEIVRGYRD